MQRNRQDKGVGGATPTPLRYTRKRIPLDEYNPEKTGRGQRGLVYDATPPEEGGFIPGIAFHISELLRMLHNGSLANGTRVVIKGQSYTVEGLRFLRAKNGKLYRAHHNYKRIEEVTETRLK